MTSADPVECPVWAVQPESAALVQSLLDTIAGPLCSADEFDALALRLFDYQYRHNLPFKRFCQGRGRTPRNLRRWQDIPAVPIDGFKDLDLRCQPAAPGDRVFMTSGTTRAEQRGRHAHPTLAVYDASMRHHFAQRFMRGQAEKMKMAILFPDEALLPHSSLAHYLALAMQTHGGPGSRNVFTPLGLLDVPALCAMLAQAETDGQPLALLGASYSFVHLLEALAAQGRSTRLPAGSRVLDTGGYKGQSQALELVDFYAGLTAALGVPAADCINMYGMTELSSQFYDHGNAVLPSVKSGPHWTRSRVIDPLSGQDQSPGEPGILVHCDLGNFNSVCSLLTEDVGVIVPGGFQLLGRAQGAQAKGCSLAVEEFIRVARG